MKWVVAHGLRHREPVSPPSAWTRFAKGQRYATLVYQFEGAPSAIRGRGALGKSLLGFFVMLRRRPASPKNLIAPIGFVWDMWQAYRKVIKNALHILDRYHIVANLSKALDDAGRGGEEEAYVLKHTRWLLLLQAA